MLRCKRKAKNKRIKHNKKRNVEEKTPQQLAAEKEIISSISEPNVWTPEKEDEWLKIQTSKEIKYRFPPLKKPPHVALQGKRYG
jgi:hypothetical protein